MNCSSNCTHQPCPTPYECSRPIAFDTLQARTKEEAISSPDDEMSDFAFAVWTAVGVALFLGLLWVAAFGVPA